MLLSRRAMVLLSVLGLALAALPAPAAAADPFLTLVDSGYNRPVFVANAGDARLFVVEQRGRISIVGGGTFLDISAKVSCCGERGLLGLAFHPNYASNGRFYVDYTRASDGATVIAEYRRSSGDPDVANPASARTVLVIGQPYANHNGGWLAFKGKYLYIATGDGGGSGDPGNRAQNKKSLLGKLLRINPLQSGSKAYTIPSTNPFVGRAGRNEIWSYGLRNPWRCSFDRATRKLWCGDVGQGSYEEVDRAKTGKGKNFGWRLLEGRHYYKSPNGPSGALCSVGCKTLPIAEYGHVGGRCAVTVGYVARRSGAALNGRYIFGDYCSGELWTIPAGFVKGGSLPSPTYITGFLVSSFGEGKDGRIYVCDYSNGRIYLVTGS
jgi:glucose/arabinose dehydrogenase